MALDETVKARLMAYCRIDALEEGEDTLLEGLYQAAVNYMADAGIGEPQEGTPRRAQYDRLSKLKEVTGYDPRNINESIPLYIAMLIYEFDHAV